MPLPHTASKPAPATSWLRRSMALFAALIAVLIWLSFLPALFKRDSLVPLGGGCWVRGYRDPVTGRDVAVDKLEFRQAEVCLALSRQGRS